MTEENTEVKVEDTEPEIEIVEESAEPTTEENSEVEQESKPVIDEDEQRQKKQISLKTKFNQTRRENYRIANENEHLKQELARLQQVSFQNQDAAMGHYDKTIELQIQQAKAEKKIALENGDLDAQLAAEEKMVSAIAQKTRNEEWKAQQDMLAKQRQAQQQQQAQQPQQQYQDEQIDAEELPADVANWIENNPWFVPNTPDFNPDVAQEVQSFSLVLERKYRRMGMEDQLYSKQFMDEIDSYVREQIMEEPEPQKQQPAQRNTLNMKPVRQNVAPVGKSAKAADGGQRKTVTLSPAEKEMAKIMNLTDQDYAKWKIKDQEKQVSRGFGPMGRTRV